MAQQLLMPKATAVWLVDNTALSFDQIAQFCKLPGIGTKTAQRLAYHILKMPEAEVKQFAATMQ